MFTEDQIKALSAPLDKSKVKSREQAGRSLSYIEGWHVIDEANRIFGFDGWNRETILLQETNRDLVTLTPRNGSPYDQWRIGYIAKVRITVGSVTREGTGYGSGMGKPDAIGDAVEGAIKEAETDAMKRALMTFGNPFGLALYDKEQKNVAENPAADAPAAGSKAPKTILPASIEPNDEFQKRIADTLIAALEKAENSVELAEWVEGADTKRTIADLPKDQADRVRVAYTAHRAALTKKAA